MTMMDAYMTNVYNKIPTDQLCHRQPPNGTTQFGTGAQVYSQYDLAVDCRTLKDEAEKKKKDDEKKTKTCTYTKKEAGSRGGLVNQTTTKQCTEEVYKQGPHFKLVNGKWVKA